MQVSVVIPVYNALARAKQCVESIFSAGSTLSFEVIVVDNGSQANVLEWLAAEEQVHAELRHLRYPEPLGFAAAVNAGAAAAEGEVIILLNSDTVVTSGWMEGLDQALQTDPSLGAVTPATNQAGEPAQMDFGTVDLTLAKALLLKRSEPSKAPDILYLPQRITFFCVALRREVWVSTGGLDESYRVGNFEDDDLCLRLRLAGYRLGVARHLFVYHHNNATFHANRISHDAWLTKNTALFATRAREAAEALAPPVRRWPKQTAHDISVVIHRKAGSLERTLRSLANQTVEGFEIVLPDSPEVSTRAWTAHISQGDIFYPFHLEALLDVLDRTSSDAVFADAWIAGSENPLPHPDASRRSSQNPLLLAGWMHRCALDCDRLWEQSAPVHWPRLTWEMQDAPTIASAPLRREPNPLIESARRFYRSSVRLETRLAIDANVRKLLGRKPPDVAETPLLDLASRLEALNAGETVAAKFAVPSELPAVIMFNAIAWNSAVQRQQHFARGLAQLGHRVFWVETGLDPPASWRPDRRLREVAPRVHLIRLPGMSREIYHMTWTPAAVDAMSAALISLASVHGLRETVSLVNYPRWQPLPMRLRERAGWKVVYDCLDDQVALADIYQTQMGKDEEWLLNGADLVFTSSAVLRERHSRHAPILLHNAADYDLFSSCSSAGHLRHLPRPVIGFFGALADWLDMDLIHASAQRFPAWSFVYIGPRTFSSSVTEAKWLRSTDLPNITVYPQMDQRTLAAHLADFDVCIMPFLDVPVTRAMNAVKLYEYLAAGKPAVSRKLPEVCHLKDGENGAGELIALYSSAEEYYQRLIDAIAGDTSELFVRRQNFARQNDWSHRVDILSRKMVELF